MVYGRYSLALALRSMSLYFFTEFELMHLIDNTKIKPKILQTARTEHDTKNIFWLFAIDSWINTALLFATAKTTCAKKVCGKEESSFEWNILMKWKITQLTLLLLQNMFMEKFENVFIYFLREKFIIALLTSLKFAVGQSRKFWWACWLTFSIVFW